MLLQPTTSNQAVLGFTNTTANFKQQQQLPRHISIPDIPNMQGQVARCYAETCFQKIVSSNLECCSVLSPAMCIPFAEKILPIRLAMVAHVGISHLQCAFSCTPYRTIMSLCGALLCHNYTDQWKPGCLPVLFVSTLCMCIVKSGLHLHARDQAWNTWTQSQTRDLSSRTLSQSA